jgi:hypothetical protein
MAALESTPRDEAIAASPVATVAIPVNGPSSSGKSTLCRARQNHLAGLAAGHEGQAYARVAFDDGVALVSERLFPQSLVRQHGGDPARLVFRQPHDGLSGWEYVADTPARGPGDGAPRLRLVLSPHARRLLAGLHRGWAMHLELGTNLIIELCDAHGLDDDMVVHSDRQCSAASVEAILAALQAPAP